MLHAAALAGAGDHPNFRADMRGGLQRTAGFVGVTTRGSTEVAETAISRVRSIHDKVRVRCATARRIRRTTRHC
ncbi:oxygenase MpaB family protein [Sphingomonas faeni]|uniref:oxygenase MpaB family protein n=1 Tax=Sphingomonas faeni TaxID=185950 RepID=UPI00335FD304